VEVQIHAFLITELDGSEWSTFQLGCFTSGEMANGTHSTASRLGSRAGLDAVT